MNSSDSLSSAANLLSVASSLATLGQQDQSNPSFNPGPITQRPKFYEVNGTVVNLYDISLIRKARNNEMCIVIYLRNGARTETSNFKYKVDYEKEYNRLAEALCRL